MGLLDHIHRFFLRFRYPVSLPENIADALGIKVSNFLTFDELIQALSNPSCRPSRLKKFMSREKAEEAFEGALHKERFQNQTLFSYYFSEGWMEFVLLFDEKSQLRRIYLQHKEIPQEEGIEIHLENQNH